MAILNGEGLTPNANQSARWNDYQRYSYPSTDWTANAIMRTIAEGVVPSGAIAVAIYDQQMSLGGYQRDPTYNAIIREEFEKLHPPEGESQPQPVYAEAAPQPGTFYQQLLSRGYKLDGNASQYLQAFENILATDARLGPGGLAFLGVDSNPVQIYGDYLLNGVRRPVTEGEVKILTQVASLPLGFVGAPGMPPAPPLTIGPSIDPVSEQEAQQQLGGDPTTSPIDTTPIDAHQIVQVMTGSGTGSSSSISSSSSGSGSGVATTSTLFEQQNGPVVTNPPVAASPQLQVTGSIDTVDVLAIGFLIFLAWFFHSRGWL